MPLHQPHRVAMPAHLGQGQRQLTLQREGRKLPPLGIDHDPQRLLDPAQVEQRLGQTEVTEPHLRPAFDHRPRQHFRPLQPPVLVGLGIGLDQAVEFNQPFRIVLLVVRPGQPGAARGAQVAEALKRPPLVLVHRARRRRPHRFPGQKRREFGQRRRVRFPQIPSFRRIRFEIVEFRQRQRHVLQEPLATTPRLGPHRCDHTAQRRPTTLQVRVQGLEVRRVLVASSQSVLRSIAADVPWGRRPPQTAAGDVRHRSAVDTRRLEHCRQDINVANRGFDPSLLQRLGPEQQRHRERRLVGEETVGVLAVIAQRLAMIRSHDNQDVRRSAR